MERELVRQLTESGDDTSVNGSGQIEGDVGLLGALVGESQVEAGSALIVADVAVLSSLGLTLSFFASLRSEMAWAVLGRVSMNEYHRARWTCEFFLRIPIAGRLAGKGGRYQGSSVSS